LQNCAVGHKHIDAETRKPESNTKLVSLLRSSKMRQECMHRRNCPVRSALITCT